MFLFSVMPVKNGQQVWHEIKFAYRIRPKEKKEIVFRFLTDPNFQVATGPKDFKATNDLLMKKSIRQRYIYEYIYMYMQYIYEMYICIAKMSTAP